MHLYVTYPLSCVRFLDGTIPNYTSFQGLLHLSYMALLGEKKPFRIHHYLVGEMILVHIKLRHAAIDDLEFVFNLSNEEAVRQMSLNSEPISLEVHNYWFAKMINQPHALFYIAFDKTTGNNIGQVRISALGEIAISIVPEARGLGLSSMIINDAIEKARRENGYTEFTAKIKTNNHPSISAFQKSRFENQGIAHVEQKFSYYIYSIKFSSSH